jgi:hypothetical protein
MRLQKHTLNLREGDVDKLREYIPDIPPTTIIRAIVSRYVDNLDQNTGKLPDVSVDL